MLFDESQEAVGAAEAPVEGAEAPQEEVPADQAV